MLLEEFLNLETERIKKELNELEVVIIDYNNSILPMGIMSKYINKL